MYIAFTLDYELFLGSKSGSIQKCLIEPLNALQRSARNVRFTIFVDATYLYRIYQLMSLNKNLKQDYDCLCSHITQLRDSGHDIQLHIHPHWVYSQYSNGEWQLDHEHYKLSDLTAHEANEVVHDSKQLLDDILGYKTTIFRAGGFSAQPTELLTSIFRNNDIIADSTVCPGTKYNSLQQLYDYTSAPNTDKYKFSNDLCKPDEIGAFTEIPISMLRVSPLFHWKLAYNRFFSSGKHQLYGDGISVKTTRDSIIHRLTKFYDCQATIDGYKINLLNKAYNCAKKNGRELLTVLGHPKLATPYSVERLSLFIGDATTRGDRFVTLKEILNE